MVKVVYCWYSSTILTCQNLLLKSIVEKCTAPPICHNHKMVCSLMEGVVVGTADQSEVDANEELLYVVDWGEAQEADAILAACQKWLRAHRDTPPQKRDALLKKYLGNQTDMEEGCALFSIHNSLVLSKGLLYISTMLKGEVEGVLAILVPTSQCTVALNGVHCDTGHQGQQRVLALAQERFWWPMMAEDCKALVWGCLMCCTFEGAVPKVPLCPVRAHTRLELVHVDFTSMESTMELNKPPSIKNMLVITDHFMCYALAIVTKDQMAKTVVRVLYERFIMVFGAPAKLLSNWGQTSPWHL